MPNRFKLDRKKIKALASAILLGAPKSAAASYAGVSTATFMHWLKDAREEEARQEAGLPPSDDPRTRIKVELLHAIEEAEGELALECLEVVKRARDRGETEWAWKILAAKYRAEFGTQQIEINTKSEVVFDYGRFINTARRPVQDSEPPSQDEDSLHGQALG